MNTEHGIEHGLPEKNELEHALTVLGYKVRETFQPLGLHVTGFRYYQPRRFQLTKSGLCLCFEAETNNRMLYGPTYDNGIRTDLQGKVFGAILSDLSPLFPDQHLCLDIEPRLVPPFTDEQSTPTVQPSTWNNRLVDVSKFDEDVFLDPVNELRQTGKIQEGSDFDVLTKKYGLTHVMRHGPFIHISPDTLSVESLEALLDQRNIRSILEIGGGIGICGIAAARRGIQDYTFVEVNPKACAHLHAVLPQYRIIEQNAFEFQFDRQYDLVLLGIPYELNPWLFQKKGRELADHADTIVIQSGMTCMYDQEHDWIMGKWNKRNWPWWNKAQELATYFPHVQETSLDWQLGAIGSHRNLETTMALMQPRGFRRAEYRHVMLEE